MKLGCLTNGFGVLKEISSEVYGFACLEP